MFAVEWVDRGSILQFADKQGLCRTSRFGTKWGCATTLVPAPVSSPCLRAHAFVIA